MPREMTAPVSPRGKAIVEAMKRKGYTTLQGAANACGIHPSTLQKALHAASLDGFSVKVVASIAITLGVEPKVLSPVLGRLVKVAA